MMEDRGNQPPASVMASRIVERVDSDLAFIPRLMGESLYLLTSHFVQIIEQALAGEGVAYGDHPLLRPFVELHARELTDFVLNGLSLRHQFGVQTLERMAGDPLRLFRVDLWDSLGALTADAEHSFLSHPSGLQALLAKVRNEGNEKTKAANA